MIKTLKNAAKSVLVYLGDSAHRRFVATVIALGATHLIGHALNADAVAAAIDVAVGGFAGAWSSRTPAIETGDQ